MYQSTKVIRLVVLFSLFIISISLLLRSMADAFTLAAVAFASVYLLHHYIIDVLGSILYVFAAVVLSEKLLQKHR